MSTEKNNQSGRIFERRDPCSPIITLGKTLSSVKMQNVTGLVEVYDDNRSQRVAMINGNVQRVVGASGYDRLEQSSSLFAMDRPRVRWLSGEQSGSGVDLHSLDPRHVIVKGLTDQRDKFDPVSLKDRIPVSTLQIDRAMIPFLKQLPVSSDVVSLLNSIVVPTPVSMILWKRGLSPEHAGALLVALNLLGVWGDQWAPGYLPQLSEAEKLVKKAGLGVSDFALLGIASDATIIEQDKSYRKLALLFHPDRMAGQSFKAKETAADAFNIITEAHSRIKATRITRRKTPSRRATANTWQSAFEAGETAATQGNVKLAKKHALHALSMNPPAFIKTRLTEILKLSE